MKPSARHLAQYGARPSQRHRATILPRAAKPGRAAACSARPTWGAAASAACRCGTRHEPFNFTPMGVNPISPGSPHVRPTGVHRTCEAPDEIKKNTHPKNITALFRDHGQAVRGSVQTRAPGYAPGAVQLHPHGGQSDSVRLPARTPHGAYVWCLTARRNQETYPPEEFYRSVSRAGIRTRAPDGCMCTRRKPFNYTPMGANSISFGSPRVRPNGSAPYVR